MSLAAVLVLIAATAGDEPQSAPPLSHADEIKIFASTLTIAKTASDMCADIKVDMAYLGALRTRMHMTDDDSATFALESKTYVAALSRGLSEAPSRQAWCDAVYRLYGPEGTMIRGLMLR